MVMVSMGIHKNRSRLNKLLFGSCLLSLSYGLIFARTANAFDWQIRPNLSFSEMFSDNLALSDAAKKSGFVTEVAPGLSLYGSSPWSNFNLNYRLQGLYNAGGRDAVDINHQLQMNSLFQVVRNTLFLQTNSSISQQNISNSFIATDNLTGNRNRTETKTYGISPYWTPNFGQYASGLFKVGYQNTSFDNSNFDNPTSINNLISDTETFSRQARLSSGAKFGIVKWNLNYSSQDQKRDFGRDVRFEQYQGDARYYLNRKFNIFGIGGYENNDYQTLNNNLHNGFFYTFGGQWTPSKWYSLEAGYGNNKHVTVRFNPSDQLTSVVTYRNKEVGLNTGDSWDVNINYRARQAMIGARYSQQTTTVQDILLQQVTFFTWDGTTRDPSGQPLFDTINFNLPFLVNDVIVSKQANLTFGYQTGKSYYNLSLYNTRRSYELNPQEDDVYGATASWQWQFAPRLNFYLRPTWQFTDISNAADVAFSNKRYDVALGFTRAIPINLGRPLMMNTRLEFRHIDQMSDSSDNDYTENRATANFAVRF